MLVKFFLSYTFSKFRISCRRENAASKILTYAYIGLNLLIIVKYTIDANCIFSTQCHHTLSTVRININRNRGLEEENDRKKVGTKYIMKNIQKVFLLSRHLICR